MTEELLRSEGFSDVKYIAWQRTDWQFLNELKRELKS